MTRSILAIAVLVPLVAGCAVDAAHQTPAAAQSPASLPFQLQVVADFESPWAMTFLPDGRMLITEKGGTLYVVSADGQPRKRVGGIPSVSSEGQGGLVRGPRRLRRWRARLEHGPRDGLAQRPEALARAVALEGGGEKVSLVAAFHAVGALDAQSKG